MQKTKKVKLLIITQKIDINDPILGFFVRWVEEFAKHFEFVTVICLEKGEFNLPPNVKVLSLGKEDSISRIKYITRFYSYIWKERKNYDKVFVHMNPIYIVLGGLFWKILYKKITLWYTHKQVDLKLRIAEKLSDIIFTAAKESFNIKSNKMCTMGHGIDIDRFKNIKKEEKENDNDNVLEILHVGRVTKIKNIDTLVETAKILKDTWNKKIHITFLGSVATKEDNEYLEKIKTMVSKYTLNSIVTFSGSVSNSDIMRYYNKSDITVNMTPTGGIDKVVLESMASGVPVLSSNEAFKTYFNEYSNVLIFKERDQVDLAQKIKHLFEGEDMKKISEFLVKKAQEKASVVSLIKNISDEIIYGKTS